MRKAEFGLAILPANLKDNISAIPLGLVFDKGKVAIQDAPDEFFPWYSFGDLLSAAMDILIAVRKLSAECVSAPVNFS